MANVNGPPHLARHISSAHSTPEPTPIQFHLRVMLGVTLFPFVIAYSTPPKTVPGGASLDPTVLDSLAMRPSRGLFESVFINRVANSGVSIDPDSTIVLFGLCHH